MLALSTRKSDLAPSLGTCLTASKVMRTWLHALLRTSSTVRNFKRNSAGILSSSNMTCLSLNDCLQVCSKILRTPCSVIWVLAKPNTFNGLLLTTEQINSRPTSVIGFEFRKSHSSELCASTVESSCAPQSVMLFPSKPRIFNLEFVVLNAKANEATPSSPLPKKLVLCFKKIRSAYQWFPWR